MTQPRPSIARLFVLVATLTGGALLGGCSADAMLDSATESTAPALGSADGNDSADRSCTLVLTSIRQAPYDGCDEDGCWMKLAGAIDVGEAALDDGGEPYVLYRGETGRYYEVPAIPSSEATVRPGMIRYQFRLERGTIRFGDGDPTLSVEVIPFLRTADGARIFDHNRHPGDFDNYVLAFANRWSVEDDLAVCNGGD